MKDNGLRLLLVGYESGNEQILHNIKKGLRTDIARRFTADCRKLGITIHGTFILGLPGETKETIRETIRVRHRHQPAHHPGLAGGAVPGHRAVQAGGGERLAHRDRRIQAGQQPGRAALAAQLPDLNAEEIYQAVEIFYRRFYFRPRKIAEMTAEMMTSWEMMKRRLREGVEFFRFLHAREV